MHIETAILTAPFAAYAYVRRSGGLKAALLSPQRSALRPLAYGVAAIAIGEIAHHSPDVMDLALHLVSGAMLCLAVLEALAWLPRPAKAGAKAR
jgi:hypothetical protein